MARAGQLEPVLVWLEPVNKSRSTRAGPCMARAGPCMARAGPCMARAGQLEPVLVWLEPVLV